jgi:hypothetical protein
MENLRILARLARSAGPYLLLELILPGGTLFALALYLHRRGHLRFLGYAGRVASNVGETLGSELMQVSDALQPAYVWPAMVHG